MKTIVAIMALPLIAWASTSTVSDHTELDVAVVEIVEEQSTFDDQIIFTGSVINNGNRAILDLRITLTFKKDGEILWSPLSQEYVSSEEYLTASSYENFAPRETGYFWIYSGLSPDGFDDYTVSFDGRFYEASGEPRVYIERTWEGYWDSNFNTEGYLINETDTEIADVHILFKFYNSYGARTGEALARAPHFYEYELSDEIPPGEAAYFVVNSRIDFDNVSRYEIEVSYVVADDTSSAKSKAVVPTSWGTLKTLHQR